MFIYQIQYIQNELEATLQGEQAALKILPNFTESTKQFTLILNPQEMQQVDPFHQLFSVFECKKSMITHLHSLLYHLTVFKVCFEKVSDTVNKFNLKYKNVPRVPDANKSQTQKQKTQELKNLFFSLTMDLYEKCKNCYAFVEKSTLVDFIPFLLRSLWSSDYAVNPVLNIKVKLTDIEWCNIPVSSREVLCWHDQIMGHIEVLGCSGKYTCPMWFKYWQFDGYTYDVLSQILTYECNYVEKALSSIQSK